MLPNIHKSKKSSSQFRECKSKEQARIPDYQDAPTDDVRGTGSSARSSSDSYPYEQFPLTNSQRGVLEASRHKERAYCVPQVNIDLLQEKNLQYLANKQSQKSHNKSNKKIIVNINKSSNNYYFNQSNSQQEIVCPPSYKQHQKEASLQDGFGQRSNSQSYDNSPYKFAHLQKAPEDIKERGDETEQGGWKSVFKRIVSCSDQKYKDNSDALVKPQSVGVFGCFMAKRRSTNSQNRINISAQQLMPMNKGQQYGFESLKSSNKKSRNSSVGQQNNQQQLHTHVVEVKQKLSMEPNPYCKNSSSGQEFRSSASIISQRQTQIPLSINLSSQQQQSTELNMTSLAPSLSTGSLRGTQTTNNDKPNQSRGGIKIGMQHENPYGKPQQLSERNGVIFIDEQGKNSLSSIQKSIRKSSSQVESSYEYEYESEEPSEPSKKLSLQTPEITSAISFGAAEARGIVEQIKSSSSSVQVSSADEKPTLSPRKAADQTNIEEPEPEKLMETPSIKKEQQSSSREQARNARDSIAEAAEEEVKEKNIEKEHFEIESIKDESVRSNSNKNGSCVQSEESENSDYRNTKNDSVVEIERQQDEPSQEESKAASPERGYKIDELMFGKLEAAELVNGNADLAIHEYDEVDGESNAYAFECVEVEVANGNQMQIEDVDVVNSKSSMADQIVELQILNNEAMKLEKLEEAADVDQRAEEDRNSEEANDRPIGSESESAQEVENEEDYQYYESQVVQILYDQKQQNQDFKDFLSNHLDYSLLPICSQYTLTQQFFQAYEYFEGIDAFIFSYFDVQKNEINSNQYKMIFQTIVEYCENLKQNHHHLLVQIFSYLPFIEIIRVISKINRKLYIVTGDLALLTSYSKIMQKVEDPQSPQIIASQHKIRKQVPKQQVFCCETDNLSFDHEKSKQFGTDQEQNQNFVSIVENYHEADADETYSLEKIAGRSGLSQQNQQAYQFFRSSLRSSLDSRIKYNIPCGGMYKDGMMFKQSMQGKMNKQDFDIIADKKSKIIIHLNKMFSLNQAQETSQNEGDQNLSYFGPVPQEPKHHDLHLDTSKSPYNNENRRYVKVRSQTLSEDVYQSSSITNDQNQLDHRDKSQRNEMSLDGQTYKHASSSSTKNNQNFKNSICVNEQVGMGLLQRSTTSSQMFQGIAFVNSSKDIYEIDPYRENSKRQRQISNIKNKEFKDLLTSTPAEAKTAAQFNNNNNNNINVVCKAAKDQKQRWKKSKMEKKQSKIRSHITNRTPDFLSRATESMKSLSSNISAQPSSVQVHENEKDDIDFRMNDSYGLKDSLLVSKQDSKVNDNDKFIIDLKKFNYQNINQNTNININLNRNNNAFAQHTHSSSLLFDAIAHKRNDSYTKDSPHDSSGEKSLVFQTPPFKKKKSSGEEYSDSHSPRRTKFTNSNNKRNPAYASNEYMGREAAKRTHSSQRQLSSAQNELLILDKKLTRPQQSSNAHSNTSLSVKAHSPDMNANNAKVEGPDFKLNKIAQIQNQSVAKAPEVLNLDQKQFRLGLEAQEAKKVRNQDKITF